MLIRHTMLVLSLIYLSPVYAEQTNDSPPVMSPDGTQQVFIRELPNQRNELWIKNTSGDNAHALVQTHEAEDVQQNLSEFNNPLFALNGKAVYFLTSAWATSNAVHVIDLTTHKQRFVTDGNSLELVPHGKYKGYLIVSKHKYHENEGGSYEDYWLVSPQGKDIKSLGEERKQVDALIH